ncbi:MAG: immunoglobulin domain-containing protein, partial [Dolichospermum sp.]
IAGTNLTVAGAPAVNEQWFWQTSPTGTSTATPYTGPLTVFTNGTYYIRTQNTLFNIWSATSASVVVSNFPSPTTPAIPVAAQNPVCAPGTTITAAPAPGGETYYWQGTDANGILTTNNASSPFSVTSTGTYYVRSQDAGGCWSNTAGLLVTVNTTIPGNPTASVPNFNYCSTENPMNVTAQVPVLSGPQTFNQTATASGTDNTNVTATVNVSGITGPVSSAVLNASIGTACTVGGGFFYYYSIIVNGTTVATQQCNQTNFDLTPYLPITSVSVVSFDDPSDGFGDFVNMSCNVIINYTGPLAVQPAYAINWYDAPTAGTLQGSGTTLNGLGTPVLPVATAGVHTFYAGTDLGGCASTGRVPVTVTVTSFNVHLTPVNITCNVFNNGYFTVVTHLC